jgi:hypothetical protein
VAASPSAHDGHDAAEKLQVNANRLWTGGVVDVPVLAPTEEGMLGNANTARLALVAAGAALAATGLMHLLLLFIPRPWQFFTWIMSLVTLAALLAPFATDAEIATKVATAAIFLAIGVAIGSLVSGVASSAVRLGGEEQPPAG